MLIARVATSQAWDETPNDRKNKAAQAMGSKGTKARAEAMTPMRLAETAKKVSAERWGAGQAVHGIRTFLLANIGKLRTIFSAIKQA